MATWQSIAARKQQEQWSRIPKEYMLSKSIAINTDNVLAVPRKCGILSQKELDITESYDATALVAEIAAGRLTSLEVTTAFCKRAAIAHQLTNCLTEIFFDRAISRAKELDEYFNKTGKTIGPFHGLPISIKDSFKVKGLDATIGYVAFAFSPSQTTSPLVYLLNQAGAVLYCKTNVPQTLGTVDSHNNLFGRTLNPGNLALTAGGSSGGEGALIGMRGSLLGVGTDVGGSIRIPAFCNGLYGVKPSVGRMPYANQEGGKLPGSSQTSIQAVAGPLATTLRDCEFFLQTMSSLAPWTVDPAVVFGDWNTQGERRDKSSIVIGVIRSDGIMDPLPPVQNAIEDVVKALKAENIRVVDVEISQLLSKAHSLANRLMGVDGRNQAFDIVEKTGEPWSPWLQGRMKRNPPLTLDQARELYGRRNELQTQMLKTWGDGTDQQIDAFILPPAAHPVPPIDTWNGFSYTIVFNLLDMSSGIIPVRPVRESDLARELPKTPPLGSWDKRNRELWNDLDKKVYLGSPLSIQVVAPRLQERRLLGAMAVVDNALRKHEIKEPFFAKL